MTILEMIEEWERGCSNTIGEKPIMCNECTQGLINAIKQSELKRQLEELKELKEKERYMDFNKSKFEDYLNNNKPGNEKGNSKS